MTAAICQTRWAGAAAVVALPAEIDATNADQIRQALLVAASRDPAALIIDMSATTFCDSAGVNTIIAVYRQAASSSTQLRLVTSEVLRIFKLIGADQLMPVYPTVAAALAHAPA